MSAEQPHHGVAHDMPPVPAYLSEDITVTVPSGCSERFADEARYWLSCAQEDVNERRQWIESADSADSRARRRTQLEEDDLPRLARAQRVVDQLPTDVVTAPRRTIRAIVDFCLGELGSDLERELQDPPFAEVAPARRLLHEGLALLDLREAVPAPNPDDRDAWVGG